MTPRFFCVVRHVREKSCYQYFELSQDQKNYILHKLDLLFRWYLKNGYPQGSEVPVGTAGYHLCINDIIDI